jgi:hypothetical protein
MVGAANFKQFLQKRIKANGKAGISDRGVITIERSGITLTFEVLFSQRYLKYILVFLKYLKNYLHDWLCIVTNSRVTI